MSIKALNENKTRWTVRVGKRHPKTKEVVTVARKYQGTEKQAIRYETELRRELDRKIDDSVRPNWREQVDQTLCHMRLKLGCTERTISNYRYSLEAFTLPAWARRPIDTISTVEIDELLEKAAAGRKVSDLSANDA